MCNCAHFDGTCGCKTASLESHVPADQISALKERYEENLFEEAFYGADIESDFLGIGKKKTADATTGEKKKVNIKNVVNDGLGIFAKVTDLLRGGKQVYSQDGVTASVGNVAAPLDIPKPAESGMSINTILMICGGVVVLAVLAFVGIKLSSKSK